MFYHDRINDDYETHQRNHAYLKDELDVLVTDAKVKRPSWFKSVLSHLGDGLIAAGTSMKERDSQVKPSKLSTSTR